MNYINARDICPPRALLLPHHAAFDLLSQTARVHRPAAIDCRNYAIDFDPSGRNRDFDNKRAVAVAVDVQERGKAAPCALRDADASSAVTRIFLQPECRGAIA